MSESTNYARILAIQEATLIVAQSTRKHFEKHGYDEGVHEFANSVMESLDALRSKKEEVAV